MGGVWADAAIKRMQRILIFLPRLLFGLTEGWIAAGDAREHLVEGFLRGHLLLAFIFAVAVLKVAGPAAYLLNVVACHDHNGMIGGAFAARAVIVDVVAQPHKTSSELIQFSAMLEFFHVPPPRPFYYIRRTGRHWQEYATQSACGLPEEKGL